MLDWRHILGLGILAIGLIIVGLFSVGLFPVSGWDSLRKDVVLSFAKPVERNCEGNNKTAEIFLRLKGTGVWQKKQPCVTNTFGLWIYSKRPNETVTSKHVSEAWRIYDTTWRKSVSHNWQNKTATKAAGYDAKDTIHFCNKKHIFDEKSVDPSNPECVMYSQNNTLLGVMYLLPFNSTLPDIGGPLITWHDHSFDYYRCYDTFPATLSYKADFCSERRARSRKMFHVWFINKSEGSFAHDMIYQENELAQRVRYNKSEFVGHVLTTGGWGENRSYSSKASS